MCFGNNGCGGCLWIIILILILFCCCGNNGFDCDNRCGNTCGCANNGCC